MGIYWNSRVKHLKPYIPGEQPKDTQFIKLNTNENPYPPPDAVLEAIAQAAGRLRLYPDPSSSELREALAVRFGVRPENVFVGNGSDEVLAFCFGAFFPSGGGLGTGVSGAGGNPGSDASSGTGEAAAEPILFPDISYSFYPVFANLWGAPYRSVPVRGDLSLETADFDVPNSGIIFPNPNAPTGIALSAAAVVQVARFQAKRQRVLIVDEAYIAFGGESVVPFTAGFDNLLVTQTFSKAASLAGLRVGYAIGNASLIEGLERIRDSFNSYPVDTLAAAAATAAVKATDYYTMINSRIMQTRERVAAALRKKGWQVLPSQANFIFARPPVAHNAHNQMSHNQAAPATIAHNMAAQTTADGSAANTAGDAWPYYEALREKGILVRHFAAPRTKAFLRISIGTDEEMDIFLAACEDIAL